MESILQIKDQNGNIIDIPALQGNDGTSVTIDSISESTENGGNNTVTFSDGSTLTVKNGAKGDSFTYEDFTPEQLATLKGTDGKTPIKGTDYFTEADKAEIVAAVLFELPKAEEDEF